LINKADANKPVVKAIKLIQTYANNSNLYKAEKLQKYLKSNKSEFLRLVAFYPQVELDEVMKEYIKKYQTKLDDDVEQNFSDELSRLIVKILHKNSSEKDDFI
jgi:hypothetical protein